MLWQRCGWLRAQTRRDNWDFLLHETCPLRKRFLYSGLLSHYSSGDSYGKSLAGCSRRWRAENCRTKANEKQPALLTIHYNPKKGFLTLHNLLKIFLFLQNILEQVGIRQLIYIKKKNTPINKIRTLKHYSQLKFPLFSNVLLFSTVKSQQLGNWY